MTILHAIELVFHTPYSPYYDKPFEYETMLELAPYFIITEEIALCSMQLLEDQYFSSIEVEVLQNFMDKVVNYPPPDGYEGYNPNSMADAPNPTWKLETGPLGEIKPNYNYLEYKGNIWSLANHLSVRCTTTTKHSAANINLTLHLMEKRKISCRPFIDHNVKGPDYQQMEILLKTSGGGDKRIYINRQYMDKIRNGEFDNVFKEGMEFISTSTTRARKIITAKQVVNEFGVLQTLELKPNPTKTKFQEIKVDQQIQRITFSPEADFDFEGNLALEFIFKNNLKSKDDETVEKYTPEIYEKEFSDYWNNHPDYISKSYPNDFITKMDEIQVKPFVSHKRRKK